MSYDKEVWKDIKGYEGLYQVSNLGRVRSLDRYREFNYSLTKSCFMTDIVSKEERENFKTSINA